MLNSIIQETERSYNARERGDHPSIKAKAEHTLKDKRSSLNIPRRVQTRFKTKAKSSHPLFGVLIREPSSTS